MTTERCVPDVRQNHREFPERKIRLLVGAEPLRRNRKVNKLARSPGSANEVLVLTDGDVRVGPRYLREGCRTACGSKDWRGDFFLPRHRRE